ncbi:MAG: hypothetical protein NVSMB47_10500 [Polyangiales bacterium]
MLAVAWPGNRAHAADEQVGKGAKSGKLAPIADVTGAVVQLDSGDVVIDLGAQRGASIGALVELWRPVTIKHPVTGKLLTDRFRIGALRVFQVGEVLSLAKPEGTLLRAVAPGDVVILPAPLAVLAPKSEAASPPTGAKGGSAAPPEYSDLDPDARALSLLFEGLRGADVELRVARYRDWAKAHPSSRFTPVVLEEARALESVAVAGGHGAVAAAPINARSFDAPTSVLAGAPLTIALEIQGRATGAVLQVRLADEPAYTPIPMHVTGLGYWSATIPATRVSAPTVSYFVEAVDETGGSVPVVGSATEPRVTRVSALPSARVDKPWESTFAMWTDYADYDRLRGKDYAWQTEGWFGMRFGDVGLRAVRSGFGVFKGRGGSLDDLDQKGLSGRTVGLTYGYVEGEWGLSTMWGLVARAVVGLGEDGVTGGGQGFVRIGNDKKTNLLIGGEFLGGVGVRGITQVELAVFPRFPILLRTEVTNQPAGTAIGGSRRLELITNKESTDGGELGVRAIAQAGWRVTPALTVFLRASYQGRTINHAGPGAGAGVSLSW